MLAATASCDHNLGCTKHARATRTIAADTIRRALSRADLEAEMAIAPAVSRNHINEPGPLHDRYSIPLVVLKWLIICEIYGIPGKGIRYKCRFARDMRAVFR